MSLLHLTPGGVHGQSIVSYHAHASLSHSLCKYLEPDVAPLQFWHRSWFNPQRPTGSLAGSHIHTGNLMHAAMEDYNTFCLTHQVLPTIKRTSKPGFIGGAAGGQLEAMNVLRTKLLAMRDVQMAFAEGAPEVSYFATHQRTAIRCRPDLDCPQVEIHWKFISRMDYLGSFIERMRYLECLAWYRRVRRALGLPDRRQVIYLCQTYAPYEIRVIEPSVYFIDEADAYGHRAIQRFQHLLAQYGDEQPWPDLSSRPQDVYHSSAGGPLNAIALPTSYERRISL